jgi:hypothetical protein
MERRARGNLGVQCPPPKFMMCHAKPMMAICTSLSSSPQLSSRRMERCSCLCKAHARELDDDLPFRSQDAMQQKSMVLEGATMGADTALHPTLQLIRDRLHMGGGQSGQHADGFKLGLVIEVSMKIGEESWRHLDDLVYPLLSKVVQAAFWAAAAPPLPSLLIPPRFTAKNIPTKWHHPSATWTSPGGRETHNMLLEKCTRIKNKIWLFKYSIIPHIVILCREEECRALFLAQCVALYRSSAYVALLMRFMEPAQVKSDHDQFVSKTITNFVKQKACTHNYIKAAHPAAVYNQQNFDF